MMGGMTATERSSASKILQRMAHSLQDRNEGA